ncbi:MAG: CpsB/CapC family capsule biosynthesis tyrosine phosphatase [Deltaproteobacteria bacterium]|nr:CpsB/CapC family capsule biosynthesis tyrosine phosphatase [Deltaproteobacteria bacterium]
MESTVEMIDLHCHILPGLDDGPQTMEESIRMCWIAYQDGIRTIVATPHTLNGVYKNGRSTILSKVNELNDALNNSELPPGQRPSWAGGRTPCLRRNASCRQANSELPLRILPGSDVHLCETTLQQVDQGEAITIGDGGKYIMIEFPSQAIPYQAERVLFQLLGRGLIPIISHPERNLEIWKRPGRYYEIIKMGCLGQVTAMSLTGEFGPKVRQWAEKLLKSWLVHFIASDAHSGNGRPPILSAAVKAAAKIVGKKEAKKMVTEYPRAILEGRRLNIPDPLPI